MEDLVSRAEHPVRPTVASGRSTARTTTRVVLDCDTGTDDAIAIMAAVGHPALELVAITTVDGNVPLADVTENTLRVLDHIGASVPVHAGATRPLVRPGFPVPREVLNAGSPEFQMRHLDLPPATSRAQETGAVQVLIDAFMSETGSETVLVATGPLTNVALALGAEPRLAARIPRLVLMGGAHGSGNVTAAAEFNVWVDPEAAESVLSAGIRDVTIIPLNATHSAQLTLDDCDRFDRIGTPAALASSSLIRHRIRTALAGGGQTVRSSPVHDALCMAHLADATVITRWVSHPVHVETAGARTLGEMVIDRRPWSTETPNARIALEADARAFADVLAAAFAS